MSNIISGKLHRNGTLTCGTCGSKRTKVNVTYGDEGESEWVSVVCAKCGDLLFYNGA